MLDILDETILLGCKPQLFAIDNKPKFWDSTWLVNAIAYC